MSRKKLSDEDVVFARELWATGKFTQGTLAKQFGVAASYLGMVLRGEVRQSAQPGSTGPPEPIAGLPEPEGLSLPKRMKVQELLTPEEIAEVEAQIEVGLAEREIAEDEILAIKERLDREAEKLLAAQAMEHTADKRTAREAAEAVEITLTLKDLEDMDPTNKLIQKAKGDLMLEAATCKVFSSLPPDVWDSPIPEILIEKTLRGER